MNTSKNLILSGTILAGGVAAAVYYISKKKNTQQTSAVDAKEICKELAITILKDINKEMFLTYQNVAMIANQIKEQAGNRISNQELKDLDKQLKEEIRHITSSILEKHGLEEKDLKHACEITFKDDKDVKNIINESKNALESACTGHPPDNKTKIPDSLTPERTLEILEKVMKESLQKIRAYFIELKGKGVKLSFNNPELIMGLHNLKLDEIKKDILAKYDLNNLDDPSTKIFQYATQKYTMENPNGFAQKMVSMEMQHQKAMETLMRDPEGSQGAIDAVGSHNRDVSSHNNLMRSEIISNPVKREREEDDPSQLSKSVPDLGSLKRQVSVDFKTYIETQKDSLKPEMIETLTKFAQSYFEDNFDGYFTKSEDKETSEKIADVEAEVEAESENKPENQESAPIENQEKKEEVSTEN